MEIWYNAYVRKGLSMKVTVGISAHHVHLTKEDLEILFGEGYELTVNRDINQPGQFASNEFVTIRTEKSEIAHIRILGPVRSYTQVELSKTDYIKLGLDAPIRESGEVEKSAKVTIIGPKGMIEREAGIIATRHIHVPVEDAEKLGLAGHDYVSVKVPGPKGGIMYHVSLRIAPNSYYEMHIDTDDANAFQIKNGEELEIYKDIEE